jgi:photosystem II stability/assembly factor-like uncharacterized protein
VDSTIDRIAQGLACVLVFLAAGIAAAQTPPSGLIQSVTVDSHDAQTVFATGANSIYRSIDRGQTWQGTRVFVEPWTVVIEPVDLQGGPDAMPVYLAPTYGSGVLRSLNGIDWNVTQGTGANMYSAVFHPIGGNAYAGGQGGIYVSEDRGASWRPLSTQVRGGVHAIVVDPGNPLNLYAASSGQGVFRSTDGGSTWIATNSGLSDLAVTDLDLHPANVSILFAATNSGVFQSVDAGAGWLMIHPEADVRALAIDASSPDTMIAVSAGAGVLRSTDGGAAWTAVTEGLEGLTHFESVAFAADGSGRAYVGSWNSALFFSDDGGQTWSAAPGSTITATPVPVDETPPPSNDEANPAADPTVLSVSIVDRNGGHVEFKDPAYFDVTIRNVGSNVAVGTIARLRWTQPEPNGTAYGVSGSWPGGVCANAECSLGNLASGQQITLRITGTTSTTNWIGDFRLLVTAGASNASDVSSQTVVDMTRTIVSIETGGGGSMGLLTTIGLWFVLGRRLTSRQRVANAAA